jgi:nucleoside-triphosphatase
MLNNILITGLPHSGKSTLVKHLTLRFENKVGFVTNEVKKDGKRIGFEIETSNLEKYILADINHRTKYQVSKYFVNIENLDKAISSFPNFKANEFLYIDEIGEMELYSENFKALTLKYLDSDNICIAAITKVYTDDFVEAIKKRHDIILVELTEENREEQVIFVEKLINKIRKAKKYLSEPERLKVIGKDRYELVSEHGIRKVTNDKGKWKCTCRFCTKYNICSHIITVQALI